MQETSKTRALWGETELNLLRGRGLDIGAGGDPVMPGVEEFDERHGDAERILDYVTGPYDYVYSSHCLEHMRDPRLALMDWWSLVKPGGVLFLIVPDEDLYEQGVWPSVNPTHYASFTICKRRSWCPDSINLLHLAQLLPGARVLSIELQDVGYSRVLRGVDQTQGPYNALAQIQCIVLKEAAR